MVVFSIFFPGFYLHLVEGKSEVQGEGLHVLVHVLQVVHRDAHLHHVHGMHRLRDIKRKVRDMTSYRSGILQDWSVICKVTGQGYSRIGQGYDSLHVRDTTGLVRDMKGYRSWIPKVRSGI